MFSCSCALIFTSSTKSVFISKTKNSEIKISDPEINDFGKYSIIGKDSVSYKLKNRTPDYILKCEKAGYKSRSLVIYPTKFNPVIFFDFAVPLICDLLFIQTVSSSVTEDDVPMVAGTFFTGIFGWFAPKFGSSRLYNKVYYFKELTSLPIKKEEYSNVNVNKVDFKISKNDVKWTSYQEFKDYFKGKSYYTETSDTSFEILNTNLTYDLDSSLKHLNFSDTSNRIIFNNQNNLFINCIIKKISGIDASIYEQTTVTAKWELTDFTKESILYSREVTDTSNWIYVENQHSKRNIIADALISGMYIFLNDTNVISNLKNPHNSFQNSFDSWDIIKIDSTANISLKYSIPSVVKSVVTIKTAKGHGSGCIISSDGYIISNYHVVGSSIDSVQIIFNNDSKANAKVIRFNPKNDLVLLKVNKNGLKPICINKTNQPEIGMEVFAIGTPEQIDLGQTVSKGIISGKRKFSNLVYLQTDVSVNPGNSGGALINSDGILLGIINSKLVGIGIEGLAFAIPTSELEESLKIKISN